MSDKELLKKNGGVVNMSSTFLNALSRGIETLYNLGRAFGTAVKYLIKGKKCI